ncbi:MAG: hypothetical protein IT306_31590 [Chloroflexi bacterium]|nr:hypothetical protein [Chloroflexota bacterium]
MHGGRIWLVSRVMLVAAVMLAAASGSGVAAPGGDVSVAEASPFAGKKDDKDSKGKKEKKQDDDRGDDFVLNGQVLEVRAEKDPPELIVGTVDGRTLIRVLKTDEIARNGVGVGDYVELTGEKINEQLFEATEISVGQRFSGSSEEAAPASASDDEESGSDEDSEEP